METSEIFRLQSLLTQTSEDTDLPTTLSNNVTSYLSSRPSHIPPLACSPGTKGFVYCCLDTLQMLSTTLPCPEEFVLSLTDQNTLTQVIQLVMGFGVAPLCEVGVCPVAVSGVGERWEACPVQRNVELQTIIRVLKLLTLDHYYGTLVVSKYLGIMISALVNILYGPSNPGRLIKQNKCKVLVSKAQHLDVTELKEFLDTLLYKTTNVVSEIVSLQLPKGTTRPPVWLLAVTNDLMRLQVTRPNGLLSVTRALFEHYGNILAYEDQGFCDKISVVIINPPRRNPEAYTRNIMEQVAVMLDGLTNATLRTQYLRLFKNLVHKLTAEHPKESLEIIWRKLFQPCYIWNEDSESKVDKQLLYGEKSIESWLGQLETIANLGVFQCIISDDIVSEFLTPLLSLYHHSFNSVSPLKNKIYTIIKELLSASNVWAGVIMDFLHVDFSGERTVRWDNGPSGGVTLRAGAQQGNNTRFSLDPNDILGGFDNVVPVTIKILKSQTTDQSDMMSNFFINLLKDLIECTTEKSNPENFLDCPKDLHHFQVSLRKGLLLDELCQNFGKKLLKNTTQTIALLKVIIVQKSENPAYEKDELLTISFGIIGTYLRKEIELTDNDEEEIKLLMDPLAKIINTSPNDEISKLANDLRICIATKINIDSLPAFEEKEGVHADESLASIIKDLDDPIIPSRAHAIMQLGKRFARKDSLVIANVVLLQKIVLDNLTHNDSYVFLAAIRCLAQMSWHDTQTILDTITFEIHNGSRKEDDRAKCMEVLLNIIKISNEMVPRYEAQIMNCLLRCVRHQNSDILRVSSFSVLGELCKFCKFGLQAFIQEIIDICEITLLEDESLLVKKGAITLLANIIESQDKSLFHELERETLKVYRLLKKVSSMDGSKEIQTRALQALGVLSNIVREFMFPKTKIKHEIKIL